MGLIAETQERNLLEDLAGKINRPYTKERGKSQQEDSRKGPLDLLGGCSSYDKKKKKVGE